MKRLWGDTAEFWILRDIILGDSTTDFVVDVLGWTLVNFDGMVNYHIYEISVVHISCSHAVWKLCMKTLLIFYFIPYRRERRAMTLWPRITFMYTTNKYTTQVWMSNVASMWTQDTNVLKIKCLLFTYLSCRDKCDILAFLNYVNYYNFFYVHIYIYFMIQKIRTLRWWLLTMQSNTQLNFERKREREGIVIN